jgi:hypothetical protein
VADDHLSLRGLRAAIPRRAETTKDILMTEKFYSLDAIELADTILKASGSNLKNYTLAKTRDAILGAAQKPIDDAVTLATALHQAEDFIEGFRDDQAQEGIHELLKQIRDALVKTGHAPSAEEMAAFNGGGA